MGAVIQNVWRSVKTICMAGVDTLRIMEPYERLRQARVKAGFKQITDAARAHGWNEITYTSHENGARGLRPAVAERYAKAYRVPAEWLLYGKGKPAAKQPGSLKTVPLVGYVGAGAQTHYSEATGGEFDEVPAPEGATESSVAVEIRGESLGSFFDRWVVHYDDVRRPVTPDMIGPLCVVGLDDGRVLIKKIKRSKTKGFFSSALSDGGSDIGRRNRVGSQGQKHGAEMTRPTRNTLFLMAIFLFLVVLTSASRAVFDDGNKLYSYCTSGHDFDETACLMSAGAYYDMMIATGFRCGARGITRGQTKDVYVKYLRDHPADRHWSAAVLAILAFQEAFSCKIPAKRTPPPVQ